MADFDILTEPIDTWPDESTDNDNRAWPRFKAAESDTMRLLRRELEHLGTAGKVVLQVVTYHGPADLRRDGELRSGAKVIHPGCRLTFVSRHGPLTYATDQFSTFDPQSWASWRANLRAIALSLQALRAVDRYGVSNHGEQYRGWQALGSQPHELSGDEAMGVLRAHAGPLGDDPRAEARALFIAAARNTRNAAGDASPSWDDVQRAARKLGLTT